MLVARPPSHPELLLSFRLVRRPDCRGALDDLESEFTTLGADDHLVVQVLLGGLPQTQILSR